MDSFNYIRRKSSAVEIGNIPLGGDNPIRIQSMTSTSTLDTEGSVAQCKRIFDAGADYVRLTAQGVREAENIGVIRQRLHDDGYTKPLVADIHFNPKAAFAAAVTTDKVAQAQALNEATLKLKEEYEERMRQARREALSQVSSAQREAAAARQEQLDRAKAQAEAIINQAKADVESQSKTAQAELEGIAPQLALSIARRILGGMTSGEQRERVQKLLREGAHG